MPTCIKHNWTSKTIYCPHCTTIVTNSNDMVKTKEEILRKILDKSFGEIELSECYQAMEEYAKQEAIAFAKFAMENTYQDMNTEDKWVIDDSEMTYNEYTDNELYTLYLQSKNKPNDNSKGRD